ncbi:MAG TPA: OmpA family protein [Nitrospira sp.]|nr:OmpA family protein [Nitrospira sp.]
MQKGPSQITSGNIAPSISGPKKDKDVLVVSWLIVSLAAIIGAIWYYSSTEQGSAREPLNGLQVSEALRNTQPVITPVSVSQPKTEVAGATTTKPGILHTDLYFEVGRKGLTDEVRTLLQAQASLLKQDANLGVLVQGYTDQQGSTTYNMKLGMKRAETVKTELINAGVAEHQIKTVSLGKEGVLCIDMSDVCRQMNRRVHLEIRPIGEEHMRTPVVATTPVPDAIQESADLGQSTGDGSLIDSLVPPANASERDHGTAPADPASGS